MIYAIEIIGRAMSMLRSGTASRRQRTVLYAAIVFAVVMLLLWVLSLSLGGGAELA